MDEEEIVVDDNVDNSASDSPVEEVADDNVDTGSSGDGAKTTYDGKDNFHNNAARKSQALQDKIRRASDRARNRGKRLNKFGDKLGKKHPKLGGAFNKAGNISNKAGNALGAAADKYEGINNGIQGANNAANAVENPLGTAATAAKNKAKEKVGQAVDMAKEAAKVAVKTAVKTAIKPFLPYIIAFVVALLVTVLNIVLGIALFVSIFCIDDVEFGGGNTETVASGNGTCSYNVNGKTVTNLKVRLLKCEGYDEVPGEQLVDFEDYIAGVVYQEVGDAPMEALKVQAIVARSFSLTRPKKMGNAYGLELKEENGQWILSLRSCTNDQVFCNVDKGCWSLRKGGQTSNKNKGDWPNCTVYSGDDSSKPWHRAPLGANSNIRKAVKETKGMVLENSKGEIVHTNFNNSNQTKWSNMANQGKDAFEILTKDYGSGKKISTPNCTSDNSEISGVNDYVQWMINLAADNSHGYSQATRLLNPNVDCSSFVYYGLLNGGGYSKSQLGSYPFDTGSMRSILEKIGFKGYKFTGVSVLKRGDILWRSGHTEVYVGDGKNVGAHTNYDGKNGDSSGKEVNVSSTGSNWSYYYRKSSD